MRIYSIIIIINRRGAQNNRAEDFDEFPPTSKSKKGNEITDSFRVKGESPKDTKTYKKHLKEHPQ